MSSSASPPPKSFFRKLLTRPTFPLRRSTAGGSSSNLNDHTIVPVIPPNDVAAFEKVWLEIHDVLIEPDEKQILKGIKHTLVPTRLNAILDSLLLELGRIPQGTTGPFLECFLNTEILHQLGSLSESDRPFGIKAEVSKFSTTLTRSLPYRLLLHSSIHQPISRHIRSCTSEYDSTGTRSAVSGTGGGYLYGAAAASPSLRARTEKGEAGDEGGEQGEEGEEENGVKRLTVRLVVELCERMRSHPLLLLVFLNDPPTPPSRPRPIGMDFVFFSTLLRYTNRQDETGRMARQGLMTLFEVIFIDRRIATPAVEKPEAEIFTLEDDDDEDAGRQGRAGDDDPDAPDRAIDQVRINLANHVMEQDVVEVLVSGLGAVYSVLPTKIKLPTRRRDDIDYEGGIIIPSTETDSDALFDINDEVEDGDESKRAHERDGPLLPCLTDDAVQDQLGLLADLIDFINYIVSCCQTPASSSTLSTTGDRLAMAFERTISTLFVSQVIAPFVGGSSVRDGSCTAIACYIARLVRETSVAEGTVMYLTVLRLLERGVEETKSGDATPFEDLSGLGFLQVIVSKTKGQLDTVRELSSAARTE